MLQAVTQDHNKIKTKSDNEREKEGQDKMGLIPSSQRYFSSFSFSFPNNSTYLTSLLKKFRDDPQKPPKGSTLLRGFSQEHHLFPKHSLETWHVSRIHPCELPKLHEHKFVSHPKFRNIFYVYKLTMLFVEVLNSRLNSLQLRGHDTTQIHKKMTKNANYEGSSQQSREDLISRRNGQGLEHLKFFTLVFLNT